MNRSTFITLLVLVTLGTLAYAVYRSTGEQITRMENGSQVIYGQPMHGLILGLCIFAGFCLLGIIYLADRDLRDPREKLTRDEREVLSKRTL